MEYTGAPMSSSPTIHEIHRRSYVLRPYNPWNTRELLLPPPPLQSMEYTGAPMSFSLTIHGIHGSTYVLLPYNLHHTTLLSTLVLETLQSFRTQVHWPSPTFTKYAQKALRISGEITTLPLYLQVNYYCI